MSVDQIVKGDAGITLTLEQELQSLGSVWASYNHGKVKGADWFIQLGQTIEQGLYLIANGRHNPAITQGFSLDVINTSLAHIENQTSGDYTSLVTAVESVKDFITLATVTAELDSKGHTAQVDSGLKVYSQNQYDLAGRESIRYYWDGLWSSENVALGESWLDRNSDFQGRIDLSDAVNDPSLNIPDVKIALAKLEAEIPENGASNYKISLGEGLKHDQLKGQDIQLLNEYTRRLTELDSSLYTYSYFTTAKDGSRQLDAVAIGQVTGSVAHSDVLKRDRLSDSRKLAGLSGPFQCLSHC